MWSSFDEAQIRTGFLLSRGRGVAPAINKSVQGEGVGSQGAPFSTLRPSNRPPRRSGRSSFWTSTPSVRGEIVSGSPLDLALLSREAGTEISEGSPISLSSDSGDEAPKSKIRCISGTVPLGTAVLLQVDRHLRDRGSFMKELVCWLLPRMI